MYTPVTGGTVGGEVVAIPGGDGVSTSTLVPPLSSPASSGAIVGLLVVGATVGAGLSTGVGIGAADALKSHSMSPPISYSSGTQHGQSTKGTCRGFVLVVVRAFRWKRRAVITRVLVWR